MTLYHYYRTNIRGGNVSTTYNILVLGSGGREHALVWKIAQSPLCGRLYCAPPLGGSNGGLADNVVCTPLDHTNPEAVIAFCQSHKIGLVVIGPEAPLVAGLADALTAAAIPTFGCSKEAARLEGSKAYTKEVCDAASIPTAAYAHFTNANAAHDYIATQTCPIVIKADGLAAGKGVVIAETATAAHSAIDDMFGGAFGAAGAEIVIEEFMEGEEASFFVLCDGTYAMPLASAQDHKRVGDGDTGANTGGMGAYSPATIITPTLTQEIMARIINPTLKTMAARGVPYRGVLYAGLMLTPDGIKLIEYNCRFGDPECQVLMLRMKSDIVPLLLGCAIGGLQDMVCEWHGEPALTLVMAAKGYPADYKKGTPIHIPQDASGGDENVVIFHAGTARDAAGDLIANGGRVLNITARGEDIRVARDAAYAAAKKINWADGFYRNDIGAKELGRRR
ncbi:MAG: phosphoribosylamine--glycine ligase [Alphaproteobacteria bacterium]|nr:phosphoribosylamine--glycine ligase [Alphaproteobacteria bacterium]